jgi:hypothetical protein
MANFHLPSQEYIDSFSAAISDFVKTKSRDGELVSPPPPPSPSPASSPAPSAGAGLGLGVGLAPTASLPGAIRASGLYPVPPMDVLQYFWLRRWLTGRGQEAVAAALEDCVAFLTIRAPASRLKWARAIVASVESERACSEILTGLTAAASGTALTPSPPLASSAHVPVHVTWAAIRDRITAATSTASATSTSSIQVSGGGAGGAVGSGSGSGSPSPSTTFSSSLPDDLFLPVYTHLLRQVTITLIPPFSTSKEYVAYSHMAECIEEQWRTVTAGDVPPSSSSPPFSSSPAPAAPGALVSGTQWRLDGLSRVELGVDNFERLGVIGSGSYGSVYVWREKRTGESRPRVRPPRPPSPLIRPPTPLTTLPLISQASSTR